MYKAFSEDAWEDYCYWQSQDKKTLKKMNLLLKDIDRNGYDGIGKPEPLVGAEESMTVTELFTKSKTVS